MKIYIFIISFLAMSFFSDSQVYSSNSLQVVHKMDKAIIKREKEKIKKDKKILKNDRKILRGTNIHGNRALIQREKYKIKTEKTFIKQEKIVLNENRRKLHKSNTKKIIKEI